MRPSSVIASNTDTISSRLLVSQVSFVLCTDLGTVEKNLQTDSFGATALKISCEKTPV